VLNAFDETATSKIHEMGVGALQRLSLDGTTTKAKPDQEEKPQRRHSHQKAGSTAVDRLDEMVP